MKIILSFLLIMSFGINAASENVNLDKAPINLLKLGVSMVQIGEKDQGCKMINGVELQYPKANQSVIQKAKYESKKFECIKEDS